MRQLERHQAHSLTRQAFSLRVGQRNKLVRGKRSNVSRPLHGFTLVEILVVIGIIVILIALLLPALGIVRSRARSTQCQSNQRQIAAALISANKALPFPLHSTAWAEKLQHYVDQEESIFICPAKDAGESDSSYGMTHRVHRMQSGDSGKIILADYDTDEIVAVVGSVSAQNWEDNHAARHGGYMNVLHFDGTVQAEDPEAIDPRFCKYFYESWRPFRDHSIKLGDCEVLPEDGLDGTDGGGADSGDVDGSDSDSDGGPPPPVDPPNCDEDIDCGPSDAPASGVNLFINGGGEEGANEAVGEVDGWFEDTPELDHWVRYRYDGKTPDRYVFEPAYPESERGDYFFFGSVGAVQSDMCQVVKVCGLQSKIDAGQVQYNLSGWLGIISTQADRAHCTAIFRDASGGVLDTVTVGPAVIGDFATAPWSSWRYAFVYKSAQGTVPAGTKTIKLTMVCVRFSGSWCDGKAENMSLVLTH